MRRGLGLRLAFVFVVVVAVAGCSEDDDPPRDGGADAGGRSGSGARPGSAPHPGGSGGSGGRGGSSGNDSLSDNFNCATYEQEAFPWPEGAADGKARRTSLQALCQGDCKPQESLAEFEARLSCVEAADDAGVIAPDEFDGGLPAGAWTRREGCGRVQFSRHSPSEARFFDFDRDSGELTGFASFDADGIVVAGTGQGFGCEAPAWVAGVVRADCASETVSVCEVR